MGGQILKPKHVCVETAYSLCIIESIRKTKADEWRGGKKPLYSEVLYSRVGKGMGHVLWENRATIKEDLQDFQRKLKRSSPKTSRELFMYLNHCIHYVVGWGVTQRFDERNVKFDIVE